MAARAARLGAAAVLFVALSGFTEALVVGVERYTAPNHAFHITMGSAQTGAGTWTVDKEIATDQNSFVLFKFTPAIPAQGATGERTVMWNTLTELVPNTDVAATDLVTGFLADRYPRGHFEIGTKIR